MGINGIALAASVAALLSWGCAGSTESLYLQTAATASVEIEILQGGTVGLGGVLLLEDSGCLTMNNTRGDVYRECGLPGLPDDQKQELMAQIESIKDGLQAHPGALDTLSIVVEDAAVGVPAEQASELIALDSPIGALLQELDEFAGEAFGRRFDFPIVPPFGDPPLGGS